MNWEDTPEQAAFRDAVRAFVRDRFPAGYTPDPDAEQSLEPEDVLGYSWPVDRDSGDSQRRTGAREWAAALAERGWITPCWPAECGGAGRTSPPSTSSARSTCTRPCLSAPLSACPRNWRRRR